MSGNPFSWIHIVLLACLSPLVAPGSALPTFEDSRVSAFERADTVIARDFDGDQIIDGIVINKSSDSFTLGAVHFLKGLGAGTFQSATQILTGISDYAPDQGLSAREQNRQGRRALYELAFDDFEDNIVSVMDGALSGGGFDAGRDIAAITVNRWPHGYSWEYNDLWDPPEWNPNNGPHLSGAAQIGRISIANSDASAYAFVNGAFDAADRAVNEQLGVS